MVDNPKSRHNCGSTPAPALLAADGPGSAEGSTSAAASLEQRVVALEAEKAEFDKYKKRASKEMSDREVEARATVLRDFLEVADDLERAIASWKAGGEEGVKSVRDGVDLVLRLLKSKLERYSVRAIEARGQPFDPRVHHAISQIPSTEATPGTVLHELQKGYRMGERLLRPAIVVVASAPPAPPPETSRSEEERAAGDRAAGRGRGHRRSWR